MVGHFFGSGGNVRCLASKMGGWRRGVLGALDDEMDALGGAFGRQGQIDQVHRVGGHGTLVCRGERGHGATLCGIEIGGFMGEVDQRCHSRTSVCTGACRGGVDSDFGVLGIWIDLSCADPHLVALVVVDWCMGIWCGLHGLRLGKRGVWSPKGADVEPTGLWDSLGHWCAVFPLDVRASFGVDSWPDDGRDVRRLSGLDCFETARIE